MSADQHDRDGASERALAETTLAALADALEPAAPDPAVRVRLLAALRGPERWSPFASEIASAFGLELGAAREALALVQDGNAWHPGFWPGSKSLITPSLRQAQAVIARLPGGIRIPQHQHAVRELTYILDGVLIENGSTDHRAGTLLAMDPGSSHEVAVPDDDECLVVFGIARP
jgi:quercetin dioxygenase-like cupin family protein